MASHAGLRLLFLKELQEEPTVSIPHVAEMFVPVAHVEVLFELAVDLKTLFSGLVDVSGNKDVSPLQERVSCKFLDSRVPLQPASGSLIVPAQR